jgi:hypothetical protein
MLDVHEQVSRSPRPKLILEMAVAKLIAIRPAHSIDDLVSKITKMQGGGTPRKKTSTARSNDSDDDAPAQTNRSGFLPSSKPKEPSLPKQRSSKSGFLPQKTPDVSKTPNKSPISPKSSEHTERKRPVFKPGNDVTARHTIGDPKGSTTTTSNLVVEPPPDPSDAFWMFVHHIRTQGKVEHTVVEQIAFVAVEGSRVQFVTPNEFNLGRMSRMRDDTFWQDALAKHFSVRNFHIRIRKKAETMETPNERQERLDDEKKKRLQNLFEKDVLFKTLSKHFEPTIKNITLAEPALLHPNLKGQK